MRKFLEILKKTKLFSGVAEEDISAMFNCLDAKIKEYKKGDFVFRQGEYLSHILVVANGSLLVQKDDYWGNRTIVNQVAVGETFGEAYIAPDSGALQNDVVAVEDSTIIFFDVKRIITVCPHACPFHSLVVQNMFFMISEKNKKLMQKLEHISKRTTREKLISYLSEQSQKHNSPEFSIPFNRQQLADFLSVDRSATSTELCKMRDEGLLTFEKNRFHLNYRKED